MDATAWACSASPSPAAGHRWGLSGSTAGNDTRTAHAPGGGRSVAVAATGTGDGDAILRAEKSVQRLMDDALCGRLD